MKVLSNKELVGLLFFDYDKFKQQNLSEQKLKSLQDLVGSASISGINVNTGQVNNECRHCKKRVSEEYFDIAVGYWFPNIWFICHKECVKEQRAEEAYECQKLDRNCNDCKFMVRDNEKQKLWNEKKKSWNEKQGGNTNILYARCTNYDKDISFIPNTSSICDGFVHRKQII